MCIYEWIPCFEEPDLTKSPILFCFRRCFGCFCFGRRCLFQAGGALVAVRVEAGPRERRCGQPAASRVVVAGGGGTKTETRSPSYVPFLTQGSPTNIDYRTKVLTSLLEDLGDDKKPIQLVVSFIRESQSG